jgi:hypothetical protein
MSSRHICRSHSVTTHTLDPRLHSCFSISSIVTFNSLTLFAAYQFSVSRLCRVSMRCSAFDIIQVFTCPSPDVSSVFYVTRTSQSCSHSTNITSRAHHTSPTLCRMSSQSYSYGLLSSVSIPVSRIYPDDGHLLWIHLGL